VGSFIWRGGYTGVNRLAAGSYGRREKWTVDSGKPVMKVGDRRAWPRLSVFRLALVVFVLVILFIATTIAVAVYRDRQSQGILSAADYPTVRMAFPSHTAHMPAEIPLGAADVRVYAPGAFGSLLPAPDHYVELRMVLPTIDGDSLSKLFMASPPIDESMDAITEGLVTADDGDRSTPLPQGFQTFVRKSGGIYQGVTFHPQTGEIIYWAFDR